jgi:hypothetical protein
MLAVSCKLAKPGVAQSSNRAWRVSASLCFRYVRHLRDLDDGMTGARGEWKQLGYLL